MDDTERDITLIPDANECIRIFQSSVEFDHHRKSLKELKVRLLHLQTKGIVKSFALEAPTFLTIELTNAELWKFLFDDLLEDVILGATGHTCFVAIYDRGNPDPRQYGRVYLDELENRHFQAIDMAFT